MGFDRERVHAYWEEEQVESMYDKHLLGAEIALVRDHLEPGWKILDAGCGEGEGTLAYAALEGARILAADFSKTRLEKAAARLAGYSNVEFQRIDFLEDYTVDADFDAIVTQRFLINITEWELQQRALARLVRHLRSGGRLVMMEGYHEGVDQLNGFRAQFGMDPIPVKWHNLFFRDDPLRAFMDAQGLRLVNEDGLGAYYLLTRGVRPVFDEKLDWDCDFNRVSSTREMAELMGCGGRFSRTKLWVFERR